MVASEHEAAAEGIDPARRRSIWQVLGYLVLGAVGMLSLVTVNTEAMSSWGLISVLPVAYTVALVLVAGSLPVLSLRSQSWPSFLVGIVTLTLLLHGAPAIAESLPRFPTAFLHVGYTDFTSQAGRILPGLDARYSWPAFFAAVGALLSALGLQTSMILLKWWPVVLNLAYLLPTWVIARKFLGDGLRTRLALWLFLILNWVGQDYFSPQSVGLLLYLTFAALILRYRDRARPAPGGLSTSRKLSTALLLVTLVAAMAAEHQLTPVVAVLLAAALTLVAGFHGRQLLPVMVAITVGWISYGAVSYWVGHSTELLGSIGDLLGNLGTSTARIKGSPTHHTIVSLRAATAVLVWGLAGVGLVTAFLRRVPGTWPLALLLAMPFWLLGAQSYGGEVLLRVYLFALAPAAVAISGMRLPGCLERSAIRRSRAGVRLVALGCAFGLAVTSVTFLVTRWGNELYEFTRQGDMQAVQRIYEMAPLGSTLLAVAPTVPWVYREIDGYNYLPYNMSEFAINDIKQVCEVLAKAPRGTDVFILVTPAQVAYGQQVYGLPATWGPDLVANLQQYQGLTQVYEADGSWIFRQPAGSNNGGDQVCG